MVSSNTEQSDKAGLKTSEKPPLKLHKKIEDIPDSQRTPEIDNEKELTNKKLKVDVKLPLNLKNKNDKTINEHSQSIPDTDIKKSLVRKTLKKDDDLSSGGKSKEVECQTKTSVVESFYEAFRRSFPFSKLNKYPLKRCLSTSLLPSESNEEYASFIKTTSTTSLNSNSATIPLYCRRKYLEGILPPNPKDMDMRDCSVIRVNPKVFRKCSNPSFSSEFSVKSKESPVVLSEEVTHVRENFICPIECFS